MLKGYMKNQKYLKSNKYHLYNKGILKGLHTLSPLGRSELSLCIYVCSLTSNTLGLQTSNTHTL